MPPGGLNIRWPDHAARPGVPAPPLQARRRAAPSPAPTGSTASSSTARKPRFGIVTTGKSYLDVRQALDDLGIDEACRRGDRPQRLQGRRCPGRSSREGVRRFAEGLEEILVVEEKRGVIENAAQGAALQLARGPPAARLRQVRREPANWILPSTGELSPAADRARHRPSASPGFDELGAARRARSPCSRRASASTAAMVVPFARTPYFCSGCPHNTSTKVPEGSRALAGIGCHYLSQFMDRSTATFTQMGGEGAAWIGQAPFVETPHVFANIGDGTYTHSGILAIRAAVAAERQHDLQGAVQRRGGDDRRPAARRRADRAARWRAQLAAEGVEPIVVVTDEPEKYPPGTEFPRRRDGAPPRRARPRCSASCASCPGVTAIVYDQTCAAEKRRRRKRGRFPDPAKRRRHQRPRLRGLRRLLDRSRTACRWCRSRPSSAASARSTSRAATRIISCLKGFCPSFVTVEGGSLRRSARPATSARTGCRRCPSRRCPALDRALRHPRHRRRRHRRGDDRRAARHGRASRRQGRRACSTCSAWRRRAARC